MDVHFSPMTLYLYKAFSHTSPFPARITTLWKGSVIHILQLRKPRFRRNEMAVPWTAHPTGGWAVLPQEGQDGLPSYQDLHPALASASCPLSPTLPQCTLSHSHPPIPIPPFPHQEEESSPSRVFLRPSAPMMTSNSNSDREWSVGRNSARQPISTRTEKWDELAERGGKRMIIPPVWWLWEMDSAARSVYHRESLQGKG